MINIIITNWVCVCNVYVHHCYHNCWFHYSSNTLLTTMESLPWFCCCKAQISQHAHHVTSIALDCYPSPLYFPSQEPTVALSRGNVRGQVYIDAKVPVTLGHGKGRHHGDSCLISLLGKQQILHVALPSFSDFFFSVFFYFQMPS